MIKILICDDQSVVCEGLRAILGTTGDIEVVGVAYNGAEAIQLAGQTNPDIILMDLKMPVMNGILATKQLRQEFPHIKVLVLTTYDTDEWVLDAIRNGAAGYILKDTPSDDIITIIRQTMQGKTYVDPGVAGTLFELVAQTSTSAEVQAIKKLSEREQDILRLLAKGLGNAEIAQRLYLSEGTIRNYLSAIFNKLGVSDRTQAALLAIKAGLV